MQVIVIFLLNILGKIFLGYTLSWFRDTKLSRYLQNKLDNFYTNTSNKLDIDHLKDHSQALNSIVESRRIKDLEQRVKKLEEQKLWKNKKIKK